jgi:hypothetical protein
VVKGRRRRGLSRLHTFINIAPCLPSESSSTLFGPRLEQCCAEICADTSIGWTVTDSPPLIACVTPPSKGVTSAGTSTHSAPSSSTSSGTGGSN